MARNKMVQCKSCGHEVSRKGKVTCPNCGRVSKPPIYKRTWFIVLAVIIVLSMIGSMGKNENTSSTDVSESAASSNNSSETKSIEDVEEKVELIDVTVDELFDLLNSNALKASNTYKYKYVRLTGELSVIDAQGNYFSLQPMNEEFTFDSILCRISDEHLDTVMELEIGQLVVVIGTITDVGEVLGYTLEVESIE